MSPTRVAIAVALGWLARKRFRHMCNLSGSAACRLADEATMLSEAALSHAAPAIDGGFHAGASVMAIVRRAL